MIAWGALVEVLARVEAVAPTDSGLLSFGAEASDGGIFVENQRICWAAAPGMQTRLADLLRSSSVSAFDFDRVYTRCRDEGGLLGEMLVAERVISEGELATALRRHSAESLLALCTDDERLTRWTSRGGRGYAPRFTFRPSDVLFDAVALEAPELQARAEAELARFTGPDRRGGAFCFDLEVDMAVPVAACGDVRVQELWTLGRWALALPEVDRELGGVSAFALAATAAGDAIISWWRDDLLFAVMCEERSAIATLTGLHLRGMQ